AGRVLTTLDPAELYPTAEAHDAVRASVSALGGEVAGLLRRLYELIGVLTAGTKRSGFFYTAADAEFLRALANSTAIALENASSYEALVELNLRLEDRVRERTAQLQDANRELADAYGELKSAETKLVHSEKMASLGRLVAGDAQARRPARGARGDAAAPRAALARSRHDPPRLRDVAARRVRPGPGEPGLHERARQRLRRDRRAGQRLGRDAARGRRRDRDHPR